MTNPNWFLKILIALQVCAFAPTVAQADPRVGNGGGTWVCKDRETLTHRWIQFVDLFEAETEFGFELIDTGSSSATQILSDYLKQIPSLSPRLHTLMADHPVDFSKVIRFLPASTGLTLIEDAFIRVRPLPESCPNGYLYYGQLANFTHDGRLLISSVLWNDAQFSEREKGALLVHEAIYKALREGMGDSDSTKTRRIVGLLFSTLEPEIKSVEIERLLNHP